MTRDERRGGGRPSLARRRMRLTGRVQGVGMRWYALSRGRQLGLDGWVRNRLDGSVDVEFQGDPQAVEDMSRLMRRGAPYARVTGCEEKSLPTDPGLVGRGFTVRPTRQGW